MKVLKNLSVSLMSFLLFIAILVFGFFFMVNSTVMNPDFVKDRIDKLDVNELLGEAVEFESSPEAEETFEQIRAIIPKVEPVIKERLSLAIDSFYDYILGERSEPDIRGVLSESFLNPEFIDSFVNEISLPELVETMMQSNGGEDQFPEELKSAIIDVVTDLEPEIKAERYRAQ